MKPTNQTVLTRKNLICNFRAPNEDLFRVWKDYVSWCQDHGRDVCYLTLSLADAFMRGVDGGAGSAVLPDPKQPITVNMSNTFTYSVARARREPYDLSCIKPEFQKTFTSVLFEGYILNKARTINREFSFRDFLEIKHDAFRRLIRKLKRKGLIVENPLRTVPRFYFLAENLGPRKKQAATTQ